MVGSIRANVLSQLVVVTSAVLTLGCGGSDDSDDAADGAGGAAAGGSSGSAGVAGSGATGGDGVGGGPTALPPDVSNPEWIRGIGHDHYNTRSNASESILTPRTVAGLEQKWRVGDAMVAGTPAYVGGNVYFADGSGILRSVDAASGTLNWDFPAVGSTSSVSVIDDVIYLGGTTMLMAVDISSGAPVEKWSAAVDRFPGTRVWSSPHVVDDRVVVGIGSSPNDPTQTFRGQIVGLDRENGDELWRFDVTRDPIDDTEYAIGVSVWSSAAVDPERKMLFIGTGQSYDLPVSPLSDSVIALDYETGEYKWHKQFTANDVFTFALLGGTAPRPPACPTPDTCGPGQANTKDSDVGAAPNLFMVGETPAVGVGDKAGRYYAMDRDTGAELWVADITVGAVFAQEQVGDTPWGGVMTVAAVHDGTIYVANNNWYGPNLLAFDFASNQNSTTVFALDTLDGSIKWDETHPAASVGGVTYAGGVVYQSTSDGVMRAFEAADGAPLWSEATGGGIAGGMTVADGFVFQGLGFSLFGGVDLAVGGLAAYGLP